MTAGIRGEQTRGVRLGRGVTGGNLAKNVALLVISRPELHLLELWAVIRLGLADVTSANEGAKTTGIDCY